MVITGAGGFAKELLQVVIQTVPIEEIAFYDDVTADGPRQLFDQFPILTNQTELYQHFDQYGNSFTLGLGGSHHRKNMYDKMADWGGQLVTTIDKQASVGSYSQIGIGCNILSSACISNSSQIGMAALIYYHSIITHDCILGEFVEISPGATILGRTTIGGFTQVGANATILSDLHIGKNCLIGAGAVVTKDVADNTLVAGVPAKIVRHRS